MAILPSFSLCTPWEISRPYFKKPISCKIDSSKSSIKQRMIHVFIHDWLNPFHILLTLFIYVPKNVWRTSSKRYFLSQHQFFHQRFLFLAHSAVRTKSYRLTPSSPMFFCNQMRKLVPLISDSHNNGYKMWFIKELKTICKFPLIESQVNNKKSFQESFTYMYCFWITL